MLWFWGGMRRRSLDLVRVSGEEEGKTEGAGIADKPRKRTGIFGCNVCRSLWEAVCV